MVNYSLLIPMKYIRLWINEYTAYESQRELSFYVDFRLFDYDDCAFGLGESESFHGTMRFLSATFSIDHEVVLDVARSPRLGPSLVLAIPSRKRLPEAPFLITNDFQTRIIFEGDVAVVDQLREASQLKHDVGYTFPVGTKNWFGALKAIGAEEPFRWHLTAFSNSPGGVLDSPVVVRQLDVDEPFGTLIVTQKN